MANGGNRGERLQVMLTGDELTVLDSFRFKQRMPSRAAAIRELLKRGLAAEGSEPKPYARSSGHGAARSDQDTKAANKDA